MKYFVEMTDTFGGEANYCWVNRFTVEAESMQAALTRVKQEVYLSASKVRHSTSNYGNMLRADVKNQNVVFFVTEFSDDDVYTNTVHLE